MIDYDKIKTKIRFDKKIYGFEWTVRPIRLIMSWLFYIPFISEISGSIPIFQDDNNKSTYITIDILGHIVCEVVGIKTTPTVSAFTSVLLYDLEIENELECLPTENH